MPEHKGVMQDMLANQLREYEGIKKHYQQIEHLVDVLIRSSQRRIHQLIYSANSRRILMTEMW